MWRPVTATNPTRQQWNQKPRISREHHSEKPQDCLRCGRWHFRDYTHLCWAIKSQCYACGDFGHYARSCTNTSKSNFHFQRNTHVNHPTNFSTPAQNHAHSGTQFTTSTSLQTNKVPISIKKVHLCSLIPATHHNKPAPGSSPNTNKRSTHKVKSIKKHERDSKRFREHLETKNTAKLFPFFRLKSTPFINVIDSKSQSPSDAHPECKEFTQVQTQTDSPHSASVDVQTDPMQCQNCEQLKAKIQDQDNDFNMWVKQVAQDRQDVRQKHEEELDMLNEKITLLQIQISNLPPPFQNQADNFPNQPATFQSHPAPFQNQLPFETQPTFQNKPPQFQTQSFQCQNQPYNPPGQDYRQPRRSKRNYRR